MDNEYGDELTLGKHKLYRKKEFPYSFFSQESEQYLRLL